MLSRLRTAHSTVTGIARLSVAALLALLMLAALIPADALSAGHPCRMDCCAGKPAHEAGSCNAQLPSVEEDESPTAAITDEHAAHHDGMMASGEMVETVVVDTTVSSGHCETPTPAATKHPASRRTPKQQPRQTNVTAQAFTTPCSADCAAAVLSLARVRRPREAVALSIAINPRPPTLVTCSSVLLNHKFSSAERRRQSRPRAPPITPVIFSA